LTRTNLVRSDPVRRAWPAKLQFGPGYFC